MRPLFNLVFSKVESVFSSKHTNRTIENDACRQRSASNAQSDLYPLRPQPKSGWVELENRKHREIVNESQGGTAVSNETGNQGVRTLLSGAIRVQSDLESFTMDQR